MPEHVGRMSTGEQLRDEGMKKTLDNTTLEYRVKFTHSYLSLVRSGEPFTSEDVVSLCGMPPNHHNTVGALMSSLLKEDLRDGVVEYLGHVKKKIAKGHGARIGQYRGL